MRLHRSFYLWLFASCLLAAVAGTGLADTPRYTAHVVVNGGFGSAPDQFGRSGIETSKRSTRLVMCFAVGPQVIAVHDRVKRDVKVFSHGGEFLRAIQLVVASGDTVRARDIAIDDTTLYILVDDLPDGSKNVPASMRLVSFNLATGAREAARTIDTSSLVPTNGRKTARGADAFLLHHDGERLWLVDSIHQMAFEIALASDTVARLAEHPVFGWGGAENRVRTDDNASAINLLDRDGQLRRRLAQTGVMVTASPSGSVFAVLQYIPIDGKLDWGITVFDAAGEPVAMAPRPNRSWRPFKAPVMEHKYELVEAATGSELYEMYANADGVHVVRWSM